MSKTGKVPKVRYRFAVCPNNEAVIEWIAQQYDLSASLSHIILDAIRDYGYTDVMANDVQSVGKVKRGRPPKQETDESETAKNIENDDSAREVSAGKRQRETETQNIPKSAAKQTEHPKQQNVSPTAFTAASFFGDE